MTNEMTDATAGRWRVVWNGDDWWLDRGDIELIEADDIADYLNAQLDALAAAEAKAALADEVRQKWLVLGPMLDGWSVRNLGEEDILPWLARYTALTEATQPKQRLTRRSASS